MTNERMTEIAAIIVAELDVVNDAAQLVHTFRIAIETHGYSEAELQILDEAFLANGIDVAPICRKKHPT